MACDGLSPAVYFAARGEFGILTRNWFHPGAPGLLVLIDRGRRWLCWIEYQPVAWITVGRQDRAASRVRFRLLTIPCVCPRTAFREIRATCDSPKSMGYASVFATSWPVLVRIDSQPFFGSSRIPVGEIAPLTRLNPLFF